ncbi:MAG: SMI1/KNR4 family protein, partial [Terricaulis sp.]
FMGLRPTQALSPVRADEVAEAEAALRTKFPSGYSQFITRFGRGILGGLVRIYTPAELLNGPRNVNDWRARIDEYWFWEQSAALLAKAKALECVVIADTVGGDELIFHPDQPDRLYVLAHDFDEAYLASEQGLETAVDWFFTSGVIDEPFEDESFESY